MVKWTSLSVLKAGRIILRLYYKSLFLMSVLLSLNVIKITVEDVEKKEMRQWDRWDIDRWQESILIKNASCWNHKWRTHYGSQECKSPWGMLRALHEGKWWKTAMESFQNQGRRVEVDGECVRETTASREDYRAAQEEAVRFFLTKSQ